MSSDATDAGLDTPDDIAAAPREKPRLRVTVASDTKSVEMWVRPTASCDLLRARVAAAFDLAPGAFRLVHGKTELRGAWCLGTAGLRRSALTVLVVGTVPRCARPPRPTRTPRRRAACTGRSLRACRRDDGRPPGRSRQALGRAPWAAGVVPTMETGRRRASAVRG